MSREAPEWVTVFDTTLRDGEQTAGVCFDPHEKLEIAHALAAMSVDVIEAGFPASSQAEREAVRAVAGAVRGSRVAALARALKEDIEAAADALSGAQAPRIHVFVNASDVQMANQLRRARPQVVKMVAWAVGHARSFVEDVEFSPMDATRADPAFVAELARVAADAGAGTINLPDTVGCALPRDVASLVRKVQGELPASVVVSFHGQDDLGLATANALAAVEAGARQVELAVNGIGERAGNTSFEEVLTALHMHGGRFGVRTGVDLSGICPLSELVERCSGIDVPPNKAIVGRNAFRHASGIHQDGVLKHRETFESLDPALVGHAVGTEIVLGKLSGRAGFASRVAQLGYPSEGDRFDRAFRAFQELASHKAEVVDDDLHALFGAGAVVGGTSASREPGFALDL